MKKKNIKEKWYLASDIEKRIMFFHSYHNDRVSLYKEHHKVHKIVFQKIPWNYDFYDELFNFCFSNLDKDFDEMIE